MRCLLKRRVNASLAAMLAVQSLAISTVAFSPIHGQGAPTKPITKPIAKPSAKSSSPASSSSSRILGTWRVTIGTVAPWVQSTEAQPNRTALVGKTVTFEPRAVRGVPIMACANARYEPTHAPAEYLFQGGLKAPANTAARTLGFKTFPVTGVSLTCDRGIFEYHLADEQSLLVALDNVIWTLDRSVGARAAADSPEGMVQRFLERHFAGDMAFTKASLAGRESSFTSVLNARMASYLAKPSDPNEAPEIDGDVFTDSQEYPTRFSVRAARGNGKTASVPVRFSDGYTAKTVTYVLKRGTAWQIDDVLSSNGGSLRAMLK